MGSMFRRLLACWLALLVGLGPWVCCCFAMQLGASVRPVEFRHQCSANDCCCSKHSQAPANRHDEKPQPAKKPCTDCSQCRPPAIIEPSTKLLAFDQSVVWLTPIDVVTRTDVPAGVLLPSGELRGDSIFPFLTVRDYLHQCHFLRC